jgi:ABC-2 type transport system ATP-binding protein
MLMLSSRPRQPMSTVALQFQSVTKHFGKIPVLRALDFSLARGEAFALVGMNGAGKTTLLKCMLDLCAIDAGDIRLFDLAHNAAHARARLAFLPERFVPPHFLTGGDFLRYVLELQSLPYRQAPALQMLAALDLDTDALSRPVRAFSKGMTQKLGLAACFLARRDLTVLDEPTSGLDPKARALLKQQLRQLKAEGRTLFFTSHSLANVAEICDRMALLHLGRLLFVGTPAELCRQHGADDLEQAFLSCIGSAEQRL